MGKSLSRKFLTAFYSSFILAMILGVGTAWNGGNPGISYLIWGSVIFFYAALFMFTYGIIVSSLLEYLFNRLVIQKNLKLTLYIILHGVFGSLVGLVSDNLSSFLIGAIAALIYSCIDVWILNIKKQEKNTKKLLYVSTGCMVLIAVILGLYGSMFNPFSFISAQFWIDAVWWSDFWSVTLYCY
ncbi:hypothetical protein JYA63_08345 [Fictibacillus nanhaiensis]|uniref:Uncharacterized protein n=1 Tax=Fictibacillus nanhaiensis TaxID=742169 RepID=A0ABS2ZSL5_9BACL|nr:hypothetical protein [Fictibacillus nanhaiensis]